MTDQSQTWTQACLMDLIAATSSLASPDGIMPSTSPAGETDLFGQVLAPASRSVPPAKTKVAPTTGTYGRIGSVLSASESLGRSLASRLRQQLAGAGSTLFALTWRKQVTPRGRPYYQLVASARRTDETDFGSWQSPTAQNAKHGSLSLSETGRDPNVLHNQVYLVSWPTASARDWKSSASNLHGINARPLNEVARLASGAISSGFLVATEKRGQLNPAFSRWLMGYPEGWDACVPMATRSSRK
jgi:hypothetical protein